MSVVNFAGVKSITIPEGSVKKITASGVVLWEKKKEIVNLIDLSNRIYVPISSPQYITAEQTRDIDYSKCYAVYANDGRRGSYPSSKISNYTNLVDVNGFTYNVSSGSGYGLEFPVDVTGRKSYTLKYNIVSGGGYVYLIKFNSDTTLSATERIDDGSTKGEHTLTITPEKGYLYSVVFSSKFTEVSSIVDNISLLETT